jgi:hypothetical protein
MDLPSRRVNPARKMKSKPSPLFHFFMATVWAESQTHYALCSGEDNGAIYIKISVVTGEDDATMSVAYDMPIATRIPSSNDPDDVTHACCYYDPAHLSATQRSNERGEVICPLLLIPWANR